MSRFTRLWSERCGGECQGDRGELRRDDGEHELPVAAQHVSPHSPQLTMQRRIEPRLESALQLVEVAAPRDIGPANRWQVLHQRDGLLRTKHLVQTLVQPVSLSFFNGIVPRPSVRVSPGLPTATAERPSQNQAPVDRSATPTPPSGTYPCSDTSVLVLGPREDRRPKAGARSPWLGGTGSARRH